MDTFPLAGVDVPRVGLGTNRLKTTPEHVAFVREAVSAGVRHIDTAHLYSGGDSERAIGEALGDGAGAGEGVLVATKGGYRAGEGRPEVLRSQIEQSLRSLRTKAIGLYYLHRVDPETPLEESLGEIKDHVDRGAIRHVGIS
jgi:pyridoxine 4-dehydrogenase